MALELGAACTCIHLMIVGSLRTLSIKREFEARCLCRALTVHTLGLSQKKSQDNDDVGKPPPK